MAEEGLPEGGITNLFLSALVITLSQAGGSDSMAETELRAKEIEPAASAVVAGTLAPIGTVVLFALAGTITKIRAYKEPSGGVATP
jgi:hypothetical protein